MLILDIENMKIKINIHVQNFVAFSSSTNEIYTSIAATT